MKTIIFFLFAVSFNAILIETNIAASNKTDPKSLLSKTPYANEKSKAPFYPDEAVSGPDLERWYFEEWNYPYGAILPSEVLNKVWSDIKKMPAEEVEDNMVENTWRLIGPYGSTTSSLAKYSGRIVDIEVGNTVNPIVATASGGLWSYLGFLPYCFSDNINSLVSGSVATNPSNASIVLYGTGEPRVKAGTGLWRSTNGGSSWTNIDAGFTMSGFFKIRFQSSTHVHAATTGGYMRSTNGGVNWTRTLTGEISDVVINPGNTNILFCSKWGDGIYKTTNNGVNWAKVTTPGIPTTDVGRVALTNGTSNSSKIYALIGNNGDNAMKGIYLSTNGGSSWSNVSPAQNVLSDQGWYNCVIGVCPTNSAIVLAGGLRLYRSSNNGDDWVEISDEIHADQHAIEWTPDGQNVYVGNDGGLALSTDQGVSFSTGTNYFPVTQYVNFDVGVSNRGVIYGGSQDNGFTGTTNGGSTWRFAVGGDGGGIAIDPNSANNIYTTRGYFLGAGHSKEKDPLIKELHGPTLIME